MGAAALGPIIEDTGIHNDLPFSIQFDFGTIQWPGRRTFKVDSAAVIATAVAGTLEFVHTRFPVRRATEMSATGIEHKNTLCVSNHPNPKILLKFRVDSKGKIRRVANSEHGLRFVQGAWEEKTKEHEEVGSQKAQDASGRDTPSSWHHIHDFSALEKTLEPGHQNGQLARLRYDLR